MNQFHIPPEVLRGNAFTKKGDIYSFGGIMYEMTTGKQPFYDQAHDTHLIIANYLMYKCRSDDSSECPTAKELYYAILNFYREFVELDMYFKIDYKSLEQFVPSSELTHCYISRSIHTLHGLHNSLEDMKTGKSQELYERIDWEKEIQNQTKKNGHSQL
ncbi:hypothetical protein Glove_54g24 [Diversispora epigaea]|uniref:Protein kinase domain-containing protein n=1 Tax=Diversispora epigaea TaxID=1348612 RepID=A0A397JF26_9GLOM|nr:hypothetical protein Glove_54g24 [Diversispora epigaea]